MRFALGEPLALGGATPVVWSGWMKIYKVCFCLLFMNKRGWMRILEATIAVLIVSSVLIVVYSQQVDRGIEPATYFYGLQREILMEISSSSDSRLIALSGDEEGLGLFIENRIPLAFGYFLRVCDLGSDVDHCKIDDASVVGAIREKEVFVEDVIISSDLGNGSSAVYAPKKVRLFVWEGRRS